MAKKLICPLMHGECIEDGKAVIVDGVAETHACRFWVTVHGMHPQTGAQISTPDCAIAWQPMLTIENTQAQRALQKEVNEMRNQNAQDAQKVANVLQGFVGIARAMFALPTAPSQEAVINVDHSALPRS